MLNGLAVIKRVGRPVFSAYNVRTGQRLFKDKRRMTYSLSRLPDASAFLDEAGSLLRAAEAENNLILGLANRLMTDPEFEGPSYYAVVHDGGKVVAAALRTSPPRKLLLTQAPAGALEPLLGDVLDLQPSGVVGPAEMARAFASLWSERTGVASSVHTNLCIYQLDKVETVPQPPGRFRVATESDLDTLVRFEQAFHEEVGETGARVSTDARIAKHSLFVWEDAQPVSCANVAGFTPTGVRVSLVYTPPADRRKGYATACVAALSKRLLDSGRSFCFLFADLGNPTSNSIYQKIGYQPVCEFVEIQLSESEGDK